jgi:thymidylate synthase
MEVHPYQLPRRVKMRRELGYMEFLQFITGIYNKEAIARVAPNVNLSLFGDAAIYGPRVLRDDSSCFQDQLENALLELQENPNSRRAVVMIHNSAEFLEDHPCISSFQFHARRGVLYATVNVRSWDLWFGAPHDLIVMGGVTQIMAKCLKLLPGTMTINAANAHIYEMSVGDVGGRAVEWSFTLPDNIEVSPMYRLQYFRKWAEDNINDPSWVKGAPSLVDEVWPKVPSLPPMKVSALAGEGS